MFMGQRMKRLTLSTVALCWASIFLLVHAQAPRAGVASGPGATAEHTRTREGRLRVFDDVWETVRARYYDPALNGADWRAERERFRLIAADAVGEPQLYAALRRMLLRLRDPHTRVFAPGENSDWRVQRAISVGFTAREVGGEVLVASVERGSEAERAGARVGDTVSKVDGEPAPAIIARRMVEQATAAPSTARAMAVARLFDGPRDSFVTISLRAPDGRARSVRARREFRVREPEFDARLSGGVGVARFNVFTQETAAAFVRALTGELKAARGLVIDLRENGGGETEAMTDIASLFLPSGLDLGRFTDRDGGVRLEPHTRQRLFSTADTPSNFKGPVVVLTGARTASASEVFAAALQERGRATLLGEATCGCVLGIRRRHTLPDSGLLDISEMDYRTGRGKRLEGAGLEPDERVAPSRRDIQSGRDAALLRAVELLKFEIRK
jgi:carboxyl-terminal processing protease